jgi:serpin B
MLERMSRRATAWSVLLPLGAAVAASACGGAPAGPPATEARSQKVRVTAPVVAPDDLTTLASDNTRFAVDLYRAARAGRDNLVLAPASVSISMAMTYAGARGTTADQMAATLHFSLPPERLHPAFDALDLALAGLDAGVTADVFQLSLVNGLWAQRGHPFLPAFLDLLAEDYGAGVRLADFAGAPEDARLAINGWVSDQTTGKIPDLLPPGSVDELTRLVLANAVYLHAPWASPFSTAAPGPFETPGGSVTVPMMLQSLGTRGWSGAGYRAVDLRYGFGLSMVIIMPDAGTFDAFEANLTAEGLADALTLGQKTLSSAAAMMPRFAFQTDLPLTALLVAMGMTDAFGDGADLSGMDGARDLHIQGVWHKVLIAVHERGTDAAAATGVVVGSKLDVTDILAIDHPFLFAIRDASTSAILFLGRVLDPSH